MSQRLTQVLSARSRRNGPLLSIFVTAGFPERDATPEIVETLAEAGADLVEIGIPFSDPIADGPVIQRASQTAIQNGMTLMRILETVEKIRHRVTLPVLLMGYLNPVIRFGPERFLRCCADIGVDGLILPDLPPEEARIWAENVHNQVDFIHLISPNLPDARIREVDRFSSSFLYCVSYTGVTGMRARGEDTVSFLQRARQIARHPLFVGFGIRSCQDVQRVATLADGVIIGTAFLELLERTSRSDRTNAIKDFIQSFRIKNGRMPRSG
jgi:tryptophan synthase alpha chain